MMFDIKPKIHPYIDAPLQDGLLAYYLSMASSSDANVQARLEREPFFLRFKDDGTAQHNIQDEPKKRLAYWRECFRALWELKIAFQKQHEALPLTKV